MSSALSGELLLLARRFRHQHKKRLGGYSRRCLNYYQVNVFYFCSREPGVMTAARLLVLLQSLRRNLRRFSRVSRLRDLTLQSLAYAQVPVTRKKLAARMGCAKGPFFRFVSRLRANASFCSTRGLRKNYPVGTRSTSGFLRRMGIKNYLLLNSGFDAAY